MIRVSSRVSVQELEEHHGGLPDDIRVSGGQPGSPVPAGRLRGILLTIEQVLRHPLVAFEPKQPVSLALGGDLLVHLLDPLLPRTWPQIAPETSSAPARMAMIPRRT
jgi:hypothetical protein